MDLEVQGRIKELAESYPKDVIVVILGAPNVESNLIQYETATRGDPTYAGPLAGVRLELKTFHVFEPEIKGLVAPSRYAGLIETLELGLETEAIVAALQTARGSEI